MRSPECSVRRLFGFTEQYIEAFSQRSIRPFPRQKVGRTYMRMNLLHIAHALLPTDTEDICTYYYCRQDSEAPRSLRNVSRCIYTSQTTVRSYWTPRSLVVRACIINFSRVLREVLTGFRLFPTVNFVLV